METPLSIWGKTCKLNTFNVYLQRALNLKIQSNNRHSLAPRTWHQVWCEKYGNNLISIDIEHLKQPGSGTFTDQQ